MTKITKNMAEELISKILDGLYQKQIKEEEQRLISLVTAKMEKRRVHVPKNLEQYVKSSKGVEIMFKEDKNLEVFHKLRIRSSDSVAKRKYRHSVHICLGCDFPLPAEGGNKIIASTKECIILERLSTLEKKKSETFSALTTVIRPGRSLEMVYSDMPELKEYIEIISPSSVVPVNTQLKNLSKTLKEANKKTVKQ